jgi:hypothetical protein
MTDFLIKTTVHSERISYRRSSPSLSLLQRVGRCSPHHTHRCGCSLAAPTVLNLSRYSGHAPRSSRSAAFTALRSPPTSAVVVNTIQLRCDHSNSCPTVPRVTSREAHRSTLLMESALYFFVRQSRINEGARPHFHPSSFSTSHPGDTRDEAPVRPVPGSRLPQEGSCYFCSRRRLWGVNGKGIFADVS